MTTAWPRAASVGARIPHDDGLPEGHTSKIMPAASAPRAIVSGRPIPSRRAGPSLTPQRPKSMREASRRAERQRRLGQRSHGRAGARDVDSVEDLGADQEPIETNTIAGVIGDPESRFETAATAWANATSSGTSPFKSSRSRLTPALHGPPHARRQGRPGVPVATIATAVDPADGLWVPTYGQVVDDQDVEQNEGHRQQRERAEDADLGDRADAGEDDPDRARPGGPPNSPNPARN